MAELIEAIIRGIAAVVELFVRMVLHSIGIIAYALWPAYRRKREAAWSGQRWRKFLELGFSGACLASLVAFFIYASVPPRPDLEAEKAMGDLIKSIHLEPCTGDEDIRIRIDGVKENAIVSVRTNGPSNIFATRRIRDLTNAIRQQVTISAQPRTNAGVEAGTNR